MDLTPGTKLASTVCATEVIIVRPPSQTLALECGGAPMVAAEEAPEAGSISAEGVALPLKEAKPLPSSD